MSRRLAMKTLSFFALALTVTGCGGTLYQPGHAWRIDPHPEAEIDEADIRAALEARPQVPEHARVAYFNLAPERDDDIEAMLGQVSGVEGTYRIPPVLVTGQRRYDDAQQAPWAERQAVSTKSLRLIAARAHCDIVVVFDYGYRSEEHTSELQSQFHLVCRLLLEKKNK